MTQSEILLENRSSKEAGVKVHLSRSIESSKAFIAEDMRLNCSISGRDVNCFNFAFPPFLLSAIRRLRGSYAPRDLSARIQMSRQLETKVLSTDTSMSSLLSQSNYSSFIQGRIFHLEWLEMVSVTIRRLSTLDGRLLLGAIKFNAAHKLLGEM